MGSWYVGEIIIDSHERTRGYNAHMYYNKQYEVNVESLKYGDYLFKTNDGKEIVFEFKTCQDFIKSMEDKSLFQELSNQSIHYEYSYLIICGDFEKTFDYLYWNVPHYRYKFKTKRVLKYKLNNQINGALNRLYSMYVPIIFVNTEEESFEKMIKISTKVSDAKKYGGITRPSKKELVQNPSVIFLTGIHDIGEKKAENIIETLNIECLNDLCKKTPSEFLSVNKVTEKNVREIWKKIHNRDVDLEIIGSDKK